MLFDVWPLTWRWTTQVSSVDTRPSEDVAQEIQRALSAEGAKTALRDSTMVEFVCPGVTGMSRWALLAPISSGYVNVEALPGSFRLTYALRFTMTFWFALAVTAGFWFLQRTPTLSLGVLLPFAVLFGGNVATSMWRFPDFLHRVVART